MFAAFFKQSPQSLPTTLCSVGPPPPPQERTAKKRQTKCNQPVNGNIPLSVRVHYLSLCRDVFTVQKQYLQDVFYLVVGLILC